MNLSKKTDIAIERLRFGEKHSRGKPLYLCQSGGKDSCVIEHLAKRSGVPFISNHNLTGIDHPELVRHLRRHYPNTIIHRAENQRKRESIAYPGYKKLYMRWFERLYEHRKATGKPLKNWDSPEQFFDFWMEDEMALKEHAGQMCLAFDS